MPSGSRRWSRCSETPPPCAPGASETVSALPWALSASPALAARAAVSPLLASPSDAAEARAAVGAAPTRRPAIPPPRWLSEFRADGLRFDSANDIPRDVAQALTWRLRSEFPGRILTAEVTPENPSSITELGFDSVWVHSFYFGAAGCCGSRALLDSIRMCCLVRSRSADSQASAHATPPPVWAPPDLVQQHRALGRGHHGCARMPSSLCPAARPVGTSCGSLASPPDGAVLPPRPRQRRGLGGGVEPRQAALRDGPPLWCGSLAGKERRNHGGGRGV